MSINIVDVSLIAPPFDFDDDPADERDLPTIFFSVVTTEDEWPDPRYALIEDD